MDVWSANTLEDPYSSGIVLGFELKTQARYGTYDISHPLHVMSICMNIARTFPSLCFWKEGMQSPLHLHSSLLLLLQIFCIGNLLYPLL